MDFAIATNITIISHDEEKLKKDSFKETKITFNSLQQIITTISIFSIDLSVCFTEWTELFL